MKPVLAIFQNQWARDPAALQRVMDRHKGDWDRQSDLARRIMALGGGKTWKHLVRHFDNLVDYMHFGEASPIVGGTSDSCFEPDRRHVYELIRHFHPMMIVCFGKVAQGVVATVVPEIFEAASAANEIYEPIVVNTCHPAARHKGAADQLGNAAFDVRLYLSNLGALK